MVGWLVRHKVCARVYNLNAIKSFLLYAYHVVPLAYKTGVTCERALLASFAFHTS